MKFSLYQRLSLSLLLVFVVIAFFFYFLSQQIEQSTRFESEQRLHLSLAANRCPLWNRHRKPAPSNAIMLI